MNRKRDAMPRRWERKQTERELAREEAKRMAEERLGREPAPDEETAPFAVVPFEAIAADAALAPAAARAGRSRGTKGAHSAPVVRRREVRDGSGGTPVGRVLEAAVICLAIAALLLGHRLHAEAQGMPLGPTRTVAVIATTPAAWLNHLLRIDKGWEGMRTWAAGFMEAPTEPQLADAAPGQPAVAGATPPSAGATASAVATPVPAGASWSAPRVPSASAPLGVYMCGDSLSMDVGAAFLNRSVDSGLLDTKRFWRNATGLSRPDAYDWPAELRREIDSEPHEAVVALFGANDGQSVEHEGQVLQLYTPEWEALYAERVGEAMDILASRGARVYWVGLPVPRSDKQAKRYAMMNVIYQAEAAKRPSVRYIDSWELFSDSSGKYAEMLKDEDGELVDMRKDDGIHFTMAGAERMADRILDVMSAEWGAELQ